MKRVYSMRKKWTRSKAADSKTITERVKLVTGHHAMKQIAHVPSRHHIQRRGTKVTDTGVEVRQYGG
jgi:hypothetical protein